MNISEEIQSSIGEAIKGAFDKPPVFNTYEPAEIPRERRQSFLGDSTTGVLPPPESDPEDTSGGNGMAQQTFSSGPTVDLELCDGSIARVSGYILP
jgi:hypothetical protein